MNWRPGDLLNLETERFVVRTMTREDVTDTFTSWIADPEVMLGLNLPRQKLTRSQAVRFVLGHNNQSTFCLAICLRESNQPIGFFIAQCDHKNSCGETSVVIGNRDYWGKNVVKEARSALLDFLFDEMNLHKIIGRPHGRNFSSIFNYRAMGFRCEAVLREQMRSIESDKRLDQLVFGILRKEWHEQRQGNTA